MTRRRDRDLNPQKSPFVLLKLVSLPRIFHQSLIVFISVLSLSESVAATPKPFSPLVKGWGGSSSIAQQPASTSQGATRTAAELAFKEGQKLYRRGTAEAKQQAIVKWEEALQLFRVVGARQKQAITLSNIGSVYSELGQQKKALEYFNQSLSIFRGVGDKKREATTLNNIGTVYSDLGEKQKALEYYNQSLPLGRMVEEKEVEALTLNYIGQIYADLGQKQKALEYYNQSLPLSRRGFDKYEEAITLNNIGRVYLDLGQKQRALEYFNQSLEAILMAWDEMGEALTLSNLGRVYSDLGQQQKALEYYNQSLKLSQLIGYKTGEAIALNNIGRVYDDVGQKQKALEYYNQSLPLSQLVGDKTQQIVTLHNIASLESDRGNLKIALTQIEAAIKIIEELRTKITTQQLRSSYFATVQDYYKFYIDLLMRLHKTNPSQGYDAKALQASESARARSLLEILTEARADIRRGVDPKLVEQERSLQQQLNATEQSRVKLLNGQYSNKQLDEIKQQIDSLITQIQQVEAQIRANSPRYAALKYPQPLNLQQIQQQVLDDDTMLLEYSLGEDRSYLWAITKTGITSYELPKRAEIEAAAQKFYRLLNSPGYRLGQQRSIVPHPDRTEPVANLSKILLEPVAKQLGNKRLIIVGDGALQYIPFAALPMPGTSGAEVVPLLIKHEIVNLPSASTLAVIRNNTNGRKPAPKTIAILADPVFSSDDERFKTLGRTQSLPPLRREAPDDVDSLALARTARESGVTFKRLPYTRTEGDRILALVPNAQSQSAFDFAANRAMATSTTLSQYQIVHFATHGILNSKNPELSGVVLSLLDAKGTPENGFLRLNDIFNLNLPAELIVLSACQTGLGQEVKGEGLVGLTRGFMYAGAPRVMVSLWSVDDQGTSELMTRFYKKMLEAKQAPAAALRTAQIEMWQEKRWQAPYYWAAFTMQGEWK